MLEIDLFGLVHGVAEGTLAIAVLAFITVVGLLIAWRPLRDRID